MTPRERITAIFYRHPVDGPVWQPRLEHWYRVNKVLGTLPSEMQDFDLRDVYDAVGASFRAYHIFNPCIVIHEGKEISVEETDDGEYTTRVVRTPVGSVRQVTKRTEHGCSRVWIEYFIKSVEDIPIVEYIYAHRTYTFDAERYREGDAWLGDRGVPTTFLQRVPLQRLFIELAGIEKTVYLLNDSRQEMEHLIRVLEENDDGYYEVVLQSPLWLINFGDNVHGLTASPRLFRRYLLPYYQKRTEQLHSANKRCHAHWDGDVKSLLPFARETGLDGIEAITPWPQGDVTLSEVQEALGDMIWLDGVPMTHFLPETSDEDLDAIAYELLDRFMPNIIMGISDEISPTGDIEKVRRISRLVESYQNR